MQSFRHFLNKASDQKTSLTKIVQFGMIFEKVIQKVKVKLSCGQRALISSLSILIIDSKDFFLQKWFSLICYLKKSHKKGKFISNWLTRRSYHNFLNSASNQRTSFTKVVQFGMLLENVIWKLKVMLSFGTRI